MYIIHNIGDWKKKTYITGNHHQSTALAPQETTSTSSNEPSINIGTIQKNQTR
jgi:hypothetical protein